MPKTYHRNAVLQSAPAESKVQAARNDAISLPARQPGRIGIVLPAFVGENAPRLMQFEVPLPEVEALTRQAHAAGSRVILNAAPAQRFSAEILRQIDVLIVNEIEAEMLSDALEIAAPPEQFVSQYRTHFGRDAIVSLGPRGLVVSSSTAVIAVAAPNVNIVDTVGAGDALVGALAAALDRKTPWMRTLKEAIAAPAQVAAGER